jgi:diguanylate cyclase (GGDEF)-like protein
LVGHVTERAGLLELDALQGLYEHILDGVIFTRPEDGAILGANPAACAILQLSEAEICALGGQLVDPDDARWAVAIEELKRTGHVAGPARVRRGDGKFIEVELTLHWFRGADGATYGCSIFHDAARNNDTARKVEELAARLREIAAHDDLTGLSNRKGLITEGMQLLTLADLRRAQVDALFVEVRGIDDLNGAAGHHAGDAALQAVGRALSVAFRRSDVVARIGGTLFFVLAMDLIDDPGTLTEHIRRHLASAETRGFVGGRIELSMGWITRWPRDPASLEELVQRSERAARTAATVAQPD